MKIVSLIIILLSTNAHAMRSFDEIFADIEGLNPNDPENIYYREKSEAIKILNLKLQELFAQDEDKITDTDFQIGLAYFNFFLSLKEISSLYYQDDTDIKKFAPKVISYFKNSPKKHVGEAQYYIGVIYSDFIFEEDSFYRAIEWFKKSVENEYPHSYIKLGNAYENGEGVRFNRKTAIKYYGKACDLGLQEGCSLYKELYELLYQ